MKTLNLARYTVSVFGAVILVGCGADAGSDLLNNETSVPNRNQTNNTNNNTGSPPIETEQFLVRDVAATDTYVFVPNASESSASIARVDARDLSVLPLRVGLGPTDVVATDLQGIGAVAYVLCEGNHTVAVVRADQPARDANGIGDVRLLSIAREINRLTLAPDGRSVVAWIDPEREIDVTAVASLQVLSLVKLGDQPGEDIAVELSVTRIIRDLEFTETGELFLLGREGVNRIDIESISEDTFVPRLNLGLDADLFPESSLEMEVAPDASFMVIRSPAEATVAIYDLTQENPPPTFVTLPATPTDIDLVETATGFLVLASGTGPDAVVLIDPVAAFAEPETYEAEVVPISHTIGQTQITPSQTHALAFSSIPLFPSLSYIDLQTRSVMSWPLRNQITSVAISPNSETAVVVHRAQANAKQTPDELFQASEGLTLVDLATGFRRPVLLQGEPTDLVMTETDSGTVLYALLSSETDGQRGVMRIDLATFRSDFVALPKEPTQIGRVGNQVFVSQKSNEGRITFLDLNTQEQRTVSGYELNAIID